MKIAIFGANGPTGRELIQQAIDKDLEVVAITRDPQDFPINHSQVTVYKADATNTPQVFQAIEDVDAVVSVVGTSYSRQEITLYSESARAYLDAMNQAGVKRLVVTSSSAVSSWTDPSWPARKRFIVQFILGKLGRTLYADMRRMEKIIAASDCHWTIMRPLGLANMPAPTQYAVKENHISGSQTARRDLAASILKAVLEDQWVGQKMAVATTNKEMSLPVTVWREGIRPLLGK